MAPAPALPPALLFGRDLSVTRGGRPLFAGLSVHLSAGEIVLLEGPNGAGKSSLLLTLAGILHPEAGTVTSDTAETPHLHLVGHASGIKTNLTVGENLDFWRTVYGPDGLSVAAALETVGLGALADLHAGVLSAGQTRRLTLARLLVSRRPVWLLDEPTAALDAAGAALVARLLVDHATGGGAALIATHDQIPLTYRHRFMRLGGGA